jgi:DAK2 domain fusion protein YloV
VVDAGAAGLVEIVRGIAAAVAGEPLPEATPRAEHDVAVDAIHQELSRYRYCTVFVVEGEGLDAAKLEAELDRLGDSLMVVGDESALKVHVHTDDPGAALSLGVAQGVVEAIEIANMHRQTEEREARLLELVPVSDVETRSGGGKAATSAPWPAPSSLRRQACEVVAVVAGDGNARLFRSLGATQIVEGGQSMNPSTAEILGAVEATAAPEVVVLPNNPNVILSAEQAAEHASKPVRVVQTRSIPAGIAALVAFDGARSAEENAVAMEEAVAAIVTGAVTTASRDVDLDGLAVRKGAYLGLDEGEPVVGGDDFEEVAEAVVEALLVEPRGLLTILTGEGAPALNGLLERIAGRHPELEVDVQEGGQPRYHLLLSAE